MIINIDLSVMIQDKQISREKAVVKLQEAQNIPVEDIKMILTKAKSMPKRFMKILDENIL